MTHQHRVVNWDDPSEHDVWTQRGDTAALLLNSVVWVLWWAVSIVLGPIHLAIRGRERAMTKGARNSGEMQ